MLRADDVSLDQRLKNVSLEYPTGRMVHILGANGAGKSSLLKILAGMLDADNGTVHWHQQSISVFECAAISNCRAWLAQSVSTGFAVRVNELFDFYLQHSQASDALFDALEVMPLMPRVFNRLSGGEQQRVLIALSVCPVWKAINRGEAVLLLDEPLAGLDIRHQHSLLRLLNDIVAMGNLVVMSCHDINISARYAQDVTMLKQGKIIASGSSERFMTQAHLSHTFDCSIQAIDVNGYKLFESQHLKR